jgi:ABC-type Co2+ transport system permease subunit
MFALSTKTFFDYYLCVSSDVNKPLWGVWGGGGVERMYRILQSVVSSFRQDSFFLMEGSTVRGMGVTLPVIIEGPSIIELWCGGGGGEAHPVFYTTLCILLFNVPIISGTVTASIVKYVSSKHQLQ